MKRAIILPAEPEMAPYIHYYIDFFKRKSINYDLIAWNRTGKNSKQTENLIMYEQVSPDTTYALAKMWGYIGFVQFVKKQLQKVRYDLIVVHTILPAVLMRHFLVEKYKGHFILDIRDRGSLFVLWKKRLKSLLDCSALNVISSAGFTQWLPKNEFCLSHNIGVNGIKGIPLEKEISFGKEITILSIGQIRFYEANRYLIDSLGGNPRFYMHYAGYGPDSDRLQKYCKLKSISNVHFSGRYMKQDEPQILAECDFINIIFPRTSGTLSAMPNRFYGAAMHRKPVIVTSGGIQAEYVKKYKLGVIVEDNENLQEKIDTYIKTFDSKEYVKGCDAFLREISQDNADFITHLSNLIEKYSQYV